MLRQCNSVALAIVIVIAAVIVNVFCLNLAKKALPVCAQAILRFWVSAPGAQVAPAFRTRPGPPAPRKVSRSQPGSGPPGPQVQAH